VPASIERAHEHLQVHRLSSTTRIVEGGARLAGGAG
jgi:hypothetical protein